MKRRKRFYEKSHVFWRVATRVAKQKKLKKLKKVLDISESYGIFVNVYFDIKTILFKNNMKSK